MKRMVLGIAAAAAAVVSGASAANAASWQPINQREARLEMRIEHGLGSGALTRAEAISLRNRLHSLERLERNFRRDGLSFAERRVLDARFDALSRSIRVQASDRQVRSGLHRH